MPGGQNRSAGNEWAIQGVQEAVQCFFLVQTKMSWRSLLSSQYRRQYNVPYTHPTGKRRITLTLFPVAKPKVFA